MLIGHDWGAQRRLRSGRDRSGGIQQIRRSWRFRRSAALTRMFTYRQLKRSFYIWFIQQVGLADAVLVAPGFWESLWADWSPGYDPSRRRR